MGGNFQIGYVRFCWKFEEGKTVMAVEKTMDKIVSLCKGRGFIFAGSEIYGGLANTWD